MVRQIDHCIITEVTVEILHRPSNITVPTVEVWWEDHCLMNCGTLCDFSEEPCQLVVCVECGGSGCKYGDYVSLRQIGGELAFLPAFAEILDEPDPFYYEQYAPPQWMLENQNFWAILSEKAGGQIRERLSGFPETEQCQPMSMREALLLLQLEAPLNFLGKFGEPPSLNKKLILAVSAGDQEIEAAAVNSFLEKYNESDEELEPAEMDADYNPITFHLDAKGFPEYDCFVRIADRIGIDLKPLGVFVPAD